MIPSAWQFVLLALAAFRLTRLVSYDDFPLIARARGWLLGEYWVQETWAHNLAVQPSLAELPGESVAPDFEGGLIELPGKPPESEAEGVMRAYRRPLLAHLFHCYWCMGWWISVACMAAWQTAPKATLLTLTPFALSGAVGLVAKNLDP